LYIVSKPDIVGPAYFKDTGLQPIKSSSFRSTRLDGIANTKSLEKHGLVFPQTESKQVTNTEASMNMALSFPTQLVC
jgi:hypothetical protein